MHDVAVLTYDGFQSLDLTGPVEVFHTATLLLGGHGGYRIRTLAPTPTVESSSGLRFTVDTTIGTDDRPIDTLVVAGGLGVHRAVTTQGFVDEVDALAERSLRVTSVCTGAFALAATGRLSGRRAVTHWAECEQLAAAYPDIEVDADAIYVHHGDVWTSAGVTAGIDLALALVADDHGPDLAHAVAGWLVLFTHRAGGQSQFSPQLTPAAREPELRALQGWIAEHLDADLSVAMLAARCAMSPRHFARQFRDQVGVTPAAYVESVRIDAARRLLETTDLTVDQIATQVGFRSDAVLHRAFARTVRTTPGTYRNHFTRSTRS
jgi:transcriptional regulator GlxA family with amidase domain